MTNEQELNAETIDKKYWSAWVQCADRIGYGSGVHDVK